MHNTQINKYQNLITDKMILAKNVFEDIKDPRVKEYLRIIIKKNKKENGGEITDELALHLPLIKSLYETYIISVDDIKEHGLIAYDEKNRQHKNSAIQVMTNSICYLNKLLTSCGLTVLSKAKLKTDEVTDSDVDDFIEEMTK